MISNDKGGVNAGLSQVTERPAGPGGVMRSIIDFPRAHVRADEDGALRITTMSGGIQRSVFYTRNEVDALEDSIRKALAAPGVTLAVAWDEDRSE